MNIFAEELVQVLAKHHHELSQLFTWRNEISPSVVVRLKASLTKATSATLNSAQIDFIAEQYAFDDADLRRLRAALLAEAVRKLVADRVSTTLAYQLGRVTLELLLSDDPAEVMQACDTLVTAMREYPDLPTAVGATRGISPDGALVSADHPLLVAARELEGAPDREPLLVIALDGVEEALYNGMLWLEIARDASERRTKAGYAAQAQIFLRSAQQQAEHCADFAQGTGEQMELLAQIADAIAEAEVTTM